LFLFFVFLLFASFSFADDLPYECKEYNVINGNDSFNFSSFLKLQGVASSLANTYDSCTSNIGCKSSAKIIEELNLSNKLFYFDSVYCVNNACVMDYAKVCNVKSDVVMKKSDLTFAYIRDNSISYINLMESCFNSKYIEENPLGIICDFVNYPDLDNYDGSSFEKKLIYIFENLWGSYFLPNNYYDFGGSSFVSSYNTLYSGFQGDHLIANNTDLVLCSLDSKYLSPNEEISSSSDLTTEVIEKYDLVFLNGLKNKYSPELPPRGSFKISSCNLFEFSCSSNNDGKECTYDNCDASTDWIVNAPKTSGTSCDGGKGTCDLTGNCIPNPVCSETKPCRQPGNPCMGVSCNSNICEYFAKPAGSSCNTNYTCNTSAECVIPNGAPNNCKVLEMDSKKYLSCDINSSNSTLNISNINLLGLGLQNKVYYNFIYDGDVSLNIVPNPYATEFDISSNNVKNNNTIIIPNNNSLSKLYFSNFKGKLISGNNLVNQLYVEDSNVDVTISGLNYLFYSNKYGNNYINITMPSNQINSISALDTSIRYMNEIHFNTYNDLIISNKLIGARSTNFYFNSVSGDSTNNIILKNTIDKNYFLDYSSIMANQITLDDVSLTLNNSFIYNDDKSIKVNALGNSAYLKLDNLNSYPFGIFDLILYSEGTKSKVISINNSAYQYFNIYPVDKKDTSYYIYLLNSNNLDVNLRYDNSLSVNNSTFYNLVYLNDSNNIHINGPDFRFIEELKDTSSIFTFGNNVYSSEISNVVYLPSTPQSITKGVVLTSGSPITFVNSVINNSKSVLNFVSVPKSESFVYNNSFSDNDRVVYTSTIGNNIYFFNNFLKNNFCVVNDSGSVSSCSATKTTLKLLNKDDTNNSYGPNSCDYLVSNDILELTLKNNYKDIPIVYYDGTQLINDSYSPKCFGGNLYYEKQAIFGCTSNCFVDGTDDDDIAETTYKNFDNAPLIYPIDISINLEHQKDIFYSYDDFLGINIVINNDTSEIYEGEFFVNILDSEDNVLFDNAFFMSIGKESSFNNNSYLSRTLESLNINSLGSYKFKVLSSTLGISSTFDFYVKSLSEVLDLSLDVKSEFDLSSEDKFYSVISMINNYETPKDFDLNIFFYDSSNILIYSELYSAKKVKEKSVGTYSSYWTFDKLNIVSPGEYTLKVVETKSDVSVDKTFNVVLNSSADTSGIKTVKTPDNSLYLVFGILIIVIGLYLYRN